MNGGWLVANRDFLVRDLVRDYCTVYSLLADQRRRFEADIIVCCGIRLVGRLHLL